MTSKVRRGNLGRIFKQLAEQWKKDTALMSSMSQSAMHPAYPRIIGMGPAALPLIFRELQQYGGHWFWALAAITGDNPVPPQEAGYVQKMTERWLDYAKEKGYLP
jgi:hypothetical protein